VIWMVRYSVRIRNKIVDIEINPFSPILGLIFLLGLWLADLTSLNLGEKGLTHMVGLNPISSSGSGVYSLYVFILALIAMFYVNYFFLKMNYRKENRKLHSFNKLLIYTQLLGLIIFFITSVAMALAGYQATFLGFYLLNLYHSTLPLIILTLFILVIDIK